MALLHPVPAFSDNYIWVVHDGRRALAVDPGDANALLDWLREQNLQLEAILVTHHHSDHTGGVAALREQTGAHVYGPAHENVPQPATGLEGGAHVEALGLDFEVIDVPGHTAGHIAYYAPDIGGRPALFCGDTLFSAGCGRLFEGTPSQMLASLDRLAQLPDDTQVCCAHEYTLSNLRFAIATDPDNTALREHARHCEELRSRNLPTLPSSIGLEKRINPFLRCREPALRQAARAHEPASPQDPLGVFTTLRAWKNTF